MSFSEPGKKVRKWYIHPEAAKRVVEQRASGDEPAEDDVAFGRHLVRIENLETRLFALRNARLEDKKRIDLIGQHLGIDTRVGQRRSSSATRDSRSIGAHEQTPGAPQKPRNGEAETPPEK